MVVNSTDKIQKNYLTTTELAELCGVSRFTILNWINKGKVNAIKTVGGKHRIPVDEVRSFMDSLHVEAVSKDVPEVANEPDSLGNCWEYPEKVSCQGKCKKCLIYEKKVGYCFVIVRKFGKEVVQCRGDCLQCGYFAEFFGFNIDQSPVGGLVKTRKKIANTV